MAFDLIIKVGNQGSDPADFHMDGMPVMIYETGEAYSDHMLKTFAIVTLPDTMRGPVTAALIPHKENDVRTRMCAGHIDLGDLAIELGNADLATNWRGFGAVAVQDGAGLNASMLQSSQNKRVWPDVPDANAITSGSCTIGPGGGGTNYTNWLAFMADIGTLTGHLTATQVNNTTSEGRTAPASLNDNSNGYRLTCTTDTPPEGDPTVGWTSTITVNFGAVLYFGGQGTVELDIGSLHVVFDSGTSGGGGSINISTNTVIAKLFIHDCLIDGSSVASQMGILVVGGAGSSWVKIWNNVVYDSGSGIQIQNATTGIWSVTNNTVKGGFRGFYTSSGGQAHFYNNVAFDTSYKDFDVASGNMFGFNNASEDTTAADVNWSGGGGGTNNQTGITPATEFESLNEASSDFLKVTDAGVCDDGGTDISVLIAENTAGIRGNARPHDVTLWSIGADEYGVEPSSSSSSESSSSSSPEPSSSSSPEPSSSSSPEPSSSSSSSPEPPPSSSSSSPEPPSSSSSSAPPTEPVVVVPTVPGGMPNMGRSLLLNSDGDSRPDLGFYGEEYVPPYYKTVQLTSGLLNVRRALFGSSADAAGQNYAVWQYMRILRSTEYASYLTALDPRTSFDPAGSLVNYPYGPDYVPRDDGLDFVGDPGLGKADGKMQMSWNVSLQGSNLVVRNLHTQQVVATPVTIDGGWTSFAPMTGHPGYKVRANAAVGFTWVVNYLSAPTAEMDPIARAAEVAQIGDSSLVELFPAREPFKLFRRLWEQHTYFPYKMTGILLALIYRTEEIRRGQQF